MISFKAYLNEAINETTHKKLIALGYKKTSSETTNTAKKTWYSHPSGKHPHSGNDLAKHLGHEHKALSYDDHHTIHKDTGEYTSRHGQGSGEMVVVNPKKGKMGDIAKNRHAQGLDT